ncbi:MAG: isochorismate synthase, partial [Acidimicrobiales bacterium]
VLVGRQGSRRWVTTVSADGAGGPAGGGAGGAGGADLGLEVAAGEIELPDGFNLSSPISHREWKALVANAVRRISQGDLAKVVLARKVEVEANRPFVVADVVSRLISLYPSCTIFSVDGLVGASPELLVRRQGDLVTCLPLAGTVARSGDTASDEALIAGLLASAKQRGEHRFVVETLADQLGPLCSELEVPSTPIVIGLRNVSHLASPIRGRLAGPGPLPTALELAALLHPTPAVGGVPREAALSYLLTSEKLDRGRYAGPVGWVDAHGDGAFAVAIRCAEVHGNRATLFAGSGVVEGSEPGAELAESQLKLQALLAALVRP